MCVGAVAVAVVVLWHQLLCAASPAASPVGFVLRVLYGSIVGLVYPRWVP